jgi:hypothetical protein
VGKLVAEKAELEAKFSATAGKAEKLKAVEEFAAKHGIGPDELVANADGAFTLISKLMEDGVIDPTGKVLVGKKEPVKPKEGDHKEPGDIDLDALLKGDTKGLTGEARLMALVSKAIEPTLKNLGKTIDEITTVQTGMLRNSWEQKIQGAYPNLTGDDVRKVFSEAAVKPKMGLLEIAKGLSEAKTKEKEALRKELASELGVNLEEFDANKLAEKGSAGGAAGMFQGMKFTLSKRRAAGDPKLKDPGAATKEYFRKSGILR